MARIRSSVRPAASGILALAAGAALLLGACSSPPATGPTAGAVVSAGSGGAGGSGASAGSGGSTTSTAASAALTPAPGWTLIATAPGPTLAIHTAPEGPVTRTLTAPDHPLALMVLDTRPGWLHVQLPERPNGSAGWVAGPDVVVTSTPWRLVVSESAHRLDVLRAGRAVEHHPVGVGKAATPTVHGTFFVTELLRTPDPDGSYGPFAFGLSAHSDVLTSFAGGTGQLGLHGTDQPSRVGTDVSHGCLRVTNDVITHLAGLLPLGTPVEIRA